MASVDNNPDLSLAILSAKYLPKVLIKLLMVVWSGSTIFGDIWRTFFMEFHKALSLSSFFLTMLLEKFGFHTFQEAVEMIHCGSIPTMIYGRGFPLPPF